MDKKKINNVVGFSLASQVIPVPSFAEKSNKDWIEYGIDNNYATYLIGLMDGSSKHNALLKKKTNLTASNGWVENTFNSEFIANINGKEDLNDIVYKNAYDLMIYGAYAMAVTWSKDKKSIARISYVNIKSLRVAKEIDESEDNERYARQEDGVEFFYISSDWGNTRKSKNKPELMQGFSEKYNDVSTQIVFVREYRPGTDFYSLPDYISAQNWISLDEQISTFHLANATNSFAPSMMVNFNGGIPTEEEMDTVERKTKAKFGNVGEAGKVIFTFSENKDTAPTFEAIELNASDERFLLLEEQIQQNIVIAHSASPVIAGISIAGKLGSSSEVEESEMMFQSQVISGKQKLLNRAYTKLAKINGIEPMELEMVTTINKETKIEEDDK